MFPKPKRRVNRDLLRRFTRMRCVVENENCFGPVAGHHIKARGSGGEDVEENLIPLCAGHHTVRPDSYHQLGHVDFYERWKDRFPGWALDRVEAYLISRRLL